MYEEIIRLEGGSQGATSIILAGVHGNEKCGIIAFKKLIPSLSIKRGEVIFAYGNPKAIEKNVRYTESNLNRLFKPEKELSEKERGSYEYARAVLLKKYLDQASALLDIHASLTPGSPRFAICNEKGKTVVKSLPVSFIVSGFDEIQPGGTDYYMNRNGKIGICLECGYYEDAPSVGFAEKCIASFLIAQGNIDGETEVADCPEIRMKSMYMTKSNHFLLKKRFKDFENVSSGQIIGIDGKQTITAEEDGVILFARNRDKVGEEAFLFGQYK